MPPAGAKRRQMDKEVDQEPDYRFTLANERTFLAWLRTAMALLAAAVAIVQLVPEFGFEGARRLVGAVLAVLGSAVAVGAVVRWRTVQSAMRHAADLPRTRMPALLGGILAVLSVVVLVLLMVGGTPA
jgi:putative membrane protein